MCVIPICIAVSAFPDLMLTTPSVQVLVHKSVELQCFAEGYPLQDVRWEFTNSLESLQFSMEYAVCESENITVCNGNANRTGNMSITYVNESAGVSRSDIEMNYAIYPPNTELQRYGTLAFANVSISQAGEYKCTLTNVHSKKATKDFSYIAKVEVQCEFRC